MNFSEFGFPYPGHLIMTYIGGSQAHGAKLGETDDTDWYGIYIPPPVKVIGLDAYEHFVTTTGGKTGGNGPTGCRRVLVLAAEVGGTRGKGQPKLPAFPLRAAGGKRYSINLNPWMK